MNIDSDFISQRSANRTKKCLSLIVSLLMLTSVIGQHMHMTESSATRKNAFLLMMDTMMIKMEAVPKSIYAGEIFLDMMIPHHEGAIRMAAYEVRFGSNDTMRQLAKSILNEQNIEVQQMKLWLRDDKYDTVKAGPGFLKEMHLSMAVMMQNMPANDIPDNTDLAFARIMIPHHQAAIDMARAVIQNGTDARTCLFAKRIIASQQIEMEQMSLFLNH